MLLMNNLQSQLAMMVKLNAYKSIKAYPNTNVTLDFSNQEYNSSDPSVNPRGLTNRW